MEESSGNYIDRLRIRVHEKRNFVSSQVLNILNESISDFRKTFEAVLNTLINMRIIAENLYECTGISHELKIPSSEPVKSEDKREEISIRLSDYLKQLVYLEDNFEFSLDFMTPERVNMLKAFFGYINWSGMSMSSVSPNERILAEIEISLNESDDRLSRGVFRDGRTRLAQLTSRIYRGIEDLSDCLREEYKLEIRERILPALAASSDSIRRQPDEAVLSVKKIFKTEMGEKPFYPVLIKEIFREDFSSQSESLQAAVLENLRKHKTTVKKTSSDTAGREASDTSLLLEGVQRLSGAGPALINIAEKLSLNADIVENRKLSFFQRIVFFFNKQPLKKREPRVFSVKILNPKDESESNIRIDFNKYISALVEEGQILLSFGNKSGDQMVKTGKLTSEELIMELTKHIKILYSALSKLPAIDLHLRNKATNSMLGSMKGIKLDLNDIQSSIIKSNKRRLEYQTQLPGGFS